MVSSVLKLSSWHLRAEIIALERLSRQSSRMIFGRNEELVTISYDYILSPVKNMKRNHNLLKLKNGLNCFHQQVT